MRSTSRVLIADTQPVFRHGLQRLLEEAGGFEVVGQAAEARQSVQLSASVQPHLVFLDGSLRSGEPDVLVQIARNGEGPRVILWAAGSDGSPLLDALRLGARGILERTAPLALAEKAARCVAVGQYWIGREAVSDMVRWLHQTHPRPGNVTASSDPHLTPREREIVSAVAAGRCNKEIAARLSVTEDTVKHHLSSVFGKFGVSTRLELAVVAIQKGLAKKTLASSA